MKRYSKGNSKRNSDRNSKRNSKRNTKKNTKMLQRMAVLLLLPQPRPRSNILWKRILLRHLER